MKAKSEKTTKSVAVSIEETNEDNELVLNFPDKVTHDETNYEFHFSLEDMSNLYGLLKACTIVRNRPTTSLNDECALDSREETLAKVIALLGDLHALALSDN